MGTIPSKELHLSVKLFWFSDLYVPKERADTAKEKSELSNFLLPLSTHWSLPPQLYLFYCVASFAFSFSKGLVTDLQFLKLYPQQSLLISRY